MTRAARRHDRCRTAEVFDEAEYERDRDIHYATPAPEMAESPWRVPALATTRELATYLGIDLDSLDILADRRGISRAAKGARLQALFQAITWK